MVLGLSPAVPSGTAVAASPPPVSQPADSLAPRYAAAAEYILRTTNLPDRGYCFVFGAGEGRLALELAARSPYVLLRAEECADSVARGRQIVHRAGIYGSRITLHETSLSRLRYRDYAAALVVSDSILARGVCEGSAAEMYRMVRPDGGEGAPLCSVMRTGCYISASRALLSAPRGVACPIATTRPGVAGVAQPERLRAPVPQSEAAPKLRSVF